MNFVELKESGAFVKKTWSDMRPEHQLETLSGGGANVWDVMGEPPEFFYFADGDRSLEGHHRLHLPRASEYYVIDGSLTVNGAATLYAADYNSAVVIMGDLVADCLIVTSDTRLYVMGEARIKGPLVSNVSDAGLVLLKKCRASHCYSLGRRPLKLKKNQVISTELKRSDWPDYSDLMATFEVGV